MNHLKNEKTIGSLGLIIFLLDCSLIKLLSFSIVLV